MSALLEGVELSKRFSGLIAVNNLSFHINNGEIFSLIGPNGAGKTTLFNIIAGVYAQDKGDLSFDGDNLKRFRSDQRCKKGIARTFQITKPFLNMTVFENVLLGSYFGSSINVNLKSAKKTTSEAIEKIGLFDKSKLYAKNLNFPDRKKLEIARALATKPRLLLLDEVVGGLNPTEAQELANIIVDINKSGVTIFMIEHVIKVVTKISDRIIVLNYGKKIAEGSPNEIISNKEVIEAYLGGIKDARNF